MERLQLGEALIKEGLITQEQLRIALADQQDSPQLFLGDILLGKGYIQEEVLVPFLGEQMGYASIVDFDQLVRSVDRLFLESSFFEEEYIRQNKLLPLEKDHVRLKVAMVDPLNLVLIDNLRASISLEIVPVIVGRTLVEKAIDYIFSDEIVDEDQRNLSNEDYTLDRMVEEAKEGQVVRLVNLVIIQAVTDGASDIHLEPISAKEIQIRYRIDGQLVKVSSPPSHLFSAIVSRIKILSKLDISERRMPQDGSFAMEIDGRMIDIRVSCMPLIYGEKVVLRILDKGSVALDIEKIGLSSSHLTIFKKVLGFPYGMLLVTGPTGSGKTTSLYACLNYLNSPYKNLNTVEDPIEYKLSGINQVQTRPDIGLDFAMVLRSFLRQDPDIIMVGEIRDRETADICVRASLTGHFVLSTLHTNSASLTIDRLIDIGIDSAMIASSLVLIVAQRLLRKLCTHCREAYDPGDRIRSEYGLDLEFIYRAVGCEHCRDLGYHGRHPIHELLSFDEEVRRQVSRNYSSSEFEEFLKSRQMKTLVSSGLELVASGVTSLEEVLSGTMRG